MHACIHVCILFVTSYYDGCCKLLWLFCFNTIGNDGIARNLLENEVVALNDTGFRFSSSPSSTLLVVTEVSKHLVLNVSRPTFLCEIFFLTLEEGVNKNWRRSKEVTRSKSAKLT